MAEFSGVDLYRLIAKQYPHEAQHAKWLVGELDRVLAKRLGIAVYENDQLLKGLPNYQFMSFGPRDSEAHMVADDPIQLPQTRNTTAGHWTLIGYYQGEPGSIEDGQGPTLAEHYLAEHKAGQ